MHDREYELLRTPLLRTRVNRAKRGTRALPKLLYLDGYQATRVVGLLRVDLSTIAPIASHIKAATRKACEDVANGRPRTP